jgi:hypothetical protein
VVIGVVAFQELKYMYCGGGEVIQIVSGFLFRAQRERLRLYLDLGPSGHG